MQPDDALRSQLRSTPGTVPGPAPGPTYVRRTTDYVRQPMQDVTPPPQLTPPAPVAPASPTPAPLQPWQQAAPVSAEVAPLVTPVVTPSQPIVPIAQAPAQPLPTAPVANVDAVQVTPVTLPQVQTSAPEPVTTPLPAVQPGPTQHFGAAPTANPPAPAKKARRWLPKWLSRGNKALVVVAVAGFMLVAGAGVMHYRSINSAQAKLATATKHITPTGTTTGSNNDKPPSTDPVTFNDITHYQVAADQPRYITIPKIGVVARVLKAGLTSDGALATPTNVSDTAWYSSSAKPGQPGAAVIDGHVSSWMTSGVFHDIKDLSPGDAIDVQLGNGTRLEYVITSTATYSGDDVDMDALMKVADGSKSGLNLITTGSTYDREAGAYTQRVAVFASLKKT